MKEMSTEISKKKNQVCRVPRYVVRDFFGVSLSHFANVLAISHYTLSGPLSNVRLVRRIRYVFAQKRPPNVIYSYAEGVRISLFDIFTCYHLYYGELSSIEASRRGLKKKLAF